MESSIMTGNRYQIDELRIDSRIFDRLMRLDSPDEYGGLLAGYLRNTRVFSIDECFDMPSISTRGHYNPVDELQIVVYHYLLEKSKREKHGLKEVFVHWHKHPKSQGVELSWLDKIRQKIAQILEPRIISCEVCPETKEIKFWRYNKGMIVNVPYKVINWSGDKKTLADMVS